MACETCEEVALTAGCAKHSAGPLTPVSGVRTLAYNFRTTKSLIGLPIVRHTTGE